jgi:protein-tyrosine phosphatase
MNTKEAALFREVVLPERVTGRLFLHSMPGWGEPLARTSEELELLNIELIVCLAPPDDIWKDAEEYARSMGNADLRCDVVAYPLVDFNLPKHALSFGAFADYVADRLRDGMNVLTHCGAGKGRTGMLACCVLISLGLTEDQSRTLVRAAQAEPEIPQQHDLVAWWGQFVAERTGKG